MKAFRLPCVLLTLLPATCTSVVAEVSGTNTTAALCCVLPTYDFGEQDNRKTIEHEFPLANNGTEPLQITKVFAGCSCVLATATSSNVPPGKESSVLAKMVLHGRAGVQRKAIYVHSNDPQQPVLRLEMTGTAVPWIEVTPEQVNFGNMEKEATDSRNIYVAWRQGLKFSVTNITCASTQFAIQTNTPPLDKNCQITVKAMPPFQSGMLKSAVSIFTDDPSCMKIEVPIITTIINDIQVVPSEVPLTGTNTPTWTTTRYVSLRSRSGKPFKILRIEPPDPAITSTILPMSDNTYRIEFPPPTLSSDIDGEHLKIITDMPGSEEAMVLLRAMKRPR